MTIRWQPKRPTEVRSYPHDWTPFLGTDTISGTPVTTSNGVTVDSVDIEAGNRSVVFNVSGGVDGTVATVTQTITSVQGKVESETFVLPIAVAEEPVSLSEAKNHLRKTDDSEDALIEGLISAARDAVEKDTSHILVRRTIEQPFSEFYSYLDLHYRPFVSFTDIDYTDADGVPQTIAAADVLLNGYRVRPVDAWPTILTYSPITVNYVAGYAPGHVPPALLSAVYVMLEILEDRGKSEPALMKARWDAYNSLVNKYRVQVL